MTPPTYAPKPVIANDELFEWVDYAGRYLNLRLVSGGVKGMDVSAHSSHRDGPSAFRVAGPTDTLAFLDALGDWASSQAAALRESS